MTHGVPALWSINGRFLSQPQTGVQRYAGEITRAIDDALTADERIARALAWEILLPADVERRPTYAAIDIRQSRYGHGYGWEQAVLPTMAKGGLVSFANLGPLAKRQQILCLHDANVFLEPSSYSRAFRLAYRGLLPALGHRVAAVTTVSSFSARMLDAFGVTAGPTPNIIANGHEHALRWDRKRSAFDAPGRFARPFVFALGSRAKHKQLDLLLGLAPALDAHGIDLVISGGGATIFAETAIETSRNVHCVGFVGDDDLASLFAQALCFAFPSRTEGFGIPLLEAMVHGAPIVSSDAASMPEVCGDAALYAAPDAPATWLAQILKLAADADLRAALRHKGRARYPKFSWREAGHRYIELAASLSPAITPEMTPRPQEPSLDHKAA